MHPCASTTCKNDIPLFLPNGRCAALKHFSSSRISIKFLTIPVPICTSAASRNRIPLFLFFPAALMQFGPSSPKHSCVLVIHPLPNPWWHLDPGRDKKLSQWLCCDYTTMPLLYCFWSEGMAGLYEQFSNMSGRGLLQSPAFMCRPEVCKQDTLSHAWRKERQGTMVNLKDLKQERVACGKPYDYKILFKHFFKQWWFLYRYSKLLITSIFFSLFILYGSGNSWGSLWNNKWPAVGQI